MATAINIKESLSNPIAVDIGNTEVQGRIVSQTMQFPFFTDNKNAVWAAQNYLRKMSYPFATLQLRVNRDEFRLEVADCFRFSYTLYGITDMVYRILEIQEEGSDSEAIIVSAMEDVYSITSTITTYTVPTNNTIPPPDRTVTPFVYQRIIEAPFVISDSYTVLIPLACRTSAYDMGFLVYMSSDGGSSYTQIGTSVNIEPFGVLVATYPITYSIDDEVGFIVDFKKDADNVITTNWTDVFSGNSNTALLGDEIISFQSITPVSGTYYSIEGVIRGRYDTIREEHPVGEWLFVIPASADYVAHSEIISGADRKFKFIPYNNFAQGDIADCTAIDLTITGRSKTPYIPANFTANDGNFAARYDDDIVLDWSPRYRGIGAGLGIPGTVLGDTTRDGLFEIEVWKDGVLKRTVTGIDAATWTYTAAMNLEDNGPVFDITESFEGSFPPEGWTTSGTTTSGSVEWIQTNSITPYDGNYCAMNGYTDYLETSWLETTVSGNDCTLTFWWKTSSIEDAGILKFYINDVLQDEISGGD